MMKSIFFCSTLVFFGQKMGWLALIILSLGAPSLLAEAKPSQQLSLQNLNLIDQAENEIKEFPFESLENLVVFYVNPRKKDEVAVLEEALKEVSKVKDYKTWVIVNVDYSWFIPKMVVLRTLNKRKKKYPKVHFAIDIGQSVTKHWQIDADQNHYFILQKTEDLDEANVLKHLSGKIAEDDAEEFIQSIPSKKEKK